MSNLRPYQYKLKNDTYGAWALPGVRRVMPVLPTGGGKTVVIGEIHREYDGHSLLMAHRQELIGQISTALAREGVIHDLLSVNQKSPLRRRLNAKHMDTFGRTFLSDRAKCYVGGVDTVKGMLDDARLKRVGLCTIDEGHHVTKTNKWGKVFLGLPDGCYGLFPTATPRRADGLGLGSHADGLADMLVEGPTPRQLINAGYLTDYQLACPRVSDIDLSNVSVSAATGDYNRDELRKAIRKSTKIVGDVVRHYQRLANGKQAVVFAIDVEEASKIANEFKDKGVRCALVTGEMDDGLRADILDRFNARDIQVLVNVDLFGEGFDVPGIEVVIMARPTKSFSLFCQQFGRALRLFISKILAAAWDTYTDEQRRRFIAESEKPYALIIDHVGNMIEHGYPDKPQAYTLDRRERRAKGSPEDAIPLRTCLNETCLKPYERSEVACPYCGTEPPPPKQRSAPEFVDGDLLLLDMEALAKLRGDVEKIDGQCYPPKGMPDYARGKLIALHNGRQDEQRKLRQAIDQWAGYNSEYPERVQHKRFYFQFGMTVPEAKALYTQDAIVMREKIESTFTAGYAQ